MYARIVSLRPIPEGSATRYELEEHTSLEGDVSSDIILSFIRDLFDEQLVVAPRGAQMRTVERIVIDFRRP